MSVSHGVTGLIICGGKATRAFPASDHLPKALFPVNGVPILSRQIEYWKSWVDNFVIVTDDKSVRAIDMYTDSFPDVDFTTVIDRDQMGIINAMLLARPHLDENVIMILGDCLCNGKFYTVGGKGFVSIGVLENASDEQIKANYEVRIDDGLVREVQEKPLIVNRKVCGLGFYWFPMLHVSPWLKEFSGSGITAFIQYMIDCKETIFPAYLRAEYSNITTLADAYAWRGL
jgi:NDP-sugar pyrophosphorylase family protein